MSYVFRKERPSSKPDLTFRYSTFGSVFGIVVSLLMIFLGLFSQLTFHRIRVPALASQAGRWVSVKTGYLWNLSPEKSILFGSLALAGICLLFWYTGKLLKPVAVIFCEQGLWLNGLGLLPWKAITDATGRTLTTYYRGMRAQAVVYDIYFQPPANVEELSPIRRFLLKLHGKPLRFRISNLSLIGSPDNGGLDWSPEQLASLINRCSKSQNYLEEIKTVPHYSVATGVHA